MMKIGEIFELKTSKGNAYMHYIFKDETNGDLVRVLPGLHTNLPEDLEHLASKQESFYIFFPLSAAKRKKIVKKVGYFNGENFTRPDFMRTEYFVQGEFLGWHIINTETWERQIVKILDDSQKSLSPWGIWNDTLLIEKLEEGWTLANWV